MQPDSMSPVHPTTWGGNAIYNKATSDYHMFVSRMTNNCPLSSWGSNSRIDHAVSKTLTGPYTFKDVAVPTWSHNAAPIALHDGTFAIVHIGTGTGSATGGSNCTTKPLDAGWMPQLHTFQSYRKAGAAAAAAAAAEVSPAAAGSTIHVSKSLEGPWLPLSPNTLGGCNNPAPWVHANGTIYIVCGGSFMRSESISGPWKTVATFSHTGGPAGAYEDPFLYNTDRGYHLIYHVYNTGENPPHGHECVNSTVSAHAFSADGFSWHMSATSPYGTQVALANGTTVTVATRERPKLWFDAEGKMTHLFNGVCSAEDCPNGPSTGCVDCKYANWDYTLVQPLDV